MENDAILPGSGKPLKIYMIFPRKRKKSVESPGFRFVIYGLADPRKWNSIPYRNFKVSLYCKIP